ICLAQVGAFREGRRIGEAWLRMTEAAHAPYNLARACAGVGLLWLRQGDLPKAAAVLERGLAVCRAGDIEDWCPTLTSAVGYTELLAGRLPAGLPLLEQALAQDAVLRHGPPNSPRVAWLSEGYVRAGRFAEALRLARQVLRLAQDRWERGYEAYALRLLGE